MEYKKIFVKIVKEDEIVPRKKFKIVFKLSTIA